MFDLDEILRRIESEGLDLLLELVVPRTTLLRRCAAVHEFDQLLYEEILAKSVDAAPFNELTGWHDIEAVPRRPGWHRVRNRAEAMKAWVAAEGHPPLLPELADLHRQLAAYFVQTGERGGAAALHHLTAIGDDHARLLFARLFDQADAAYDLPRCHELLAIVEEHLPELPREFKALLADRRSYFEARTFWRDDHYRSALYLERPSVTDALTTFLGGPKWIANLYAEGGAGKTAALRWLIARWAVPAPQRIPVARVDFDFFDASTALTNPAVILGHLAEQLDRQMPSAPFERLRPEIAAYAERVAVTGHTIEGLAEDLTMAFGSILADARPALPTLIIFDTMEMAVVHERGEFGPVVTLLRMIHEQAPAVRFILSGRYDLRERMPALATLGDDVEHIEVDLFSADDARDYLVRKRGVRPELVDVVVRKSIHHQRGRKPTCLPLKLSLFGDVLNTEDLTAEDIAAYDRIDLVHLIERVVKRLGRRIDDKRDRRLERLQWLLRYGVVPRRLTRSFLSTIIAPLAEKAMSGEVSFDDCRSNLPERVRDQVFAHDLLLPGKTLDVDELWGDLLRFAAERSWVSRDSNHPDMVTFPNVSNPMRRLIENEPVFRMLHHEAIRYYDERAASRSADWIMDVREAIYHRFQLATPDAESFWHARVEEARGISPETLEQIAREITSPEYFEDDGPLTRKDGSPIVRRALVAEAFTIESETLMHQARRDVRDGAKWQAAAAAATKAERLLNEDDVPALRLRIALVRAEFELWSGNAAEAQRLAESIVSDDRMVLLRKQLLLAHAAQRRGEPMEALDGFYSARETAVAVGAFAKEPGLTSDELAAIEEELSRGIVEQTFELGFFARGFGQLFEQYDLAQFRGTDTWPIALRVAHACRDAGLHVTGAMWAIKHSPEAQPSVETVLLTIDATLSLFLASDALQRCESLLEALGPLEPDQTPHIAEAHELHARALALLGDANASRLAYEEAIRAWERAGDVERLTACLQNAAAVALWEFHDPVTEHLGRLARLREGGSRRAKWRTTRLQIETSREGAAADRWEFPLWTPLEAIDLAIASLRTGDDGERWSQLLVKALALIEPPLARLPPLALMSTVQPIPNTCSGRLLELLPNLDGGEGLDAMVTPMDRLRLAIPRADVLRVFGLQDEAERTLQWARQNVDADQFPLLSREIRRATSRLRGEEPVSIGSEVETLHAHDLRFPASAGDIEIVDVEIDGDGVTVTRPASPAAFSSRPNPPFGGVGSRSSEIVSWSFIRQFARDIERSADFFARYLFESDPPFGWPEGDFDLRLLLGESAWHAIPWELARTSSKFPELGRLRHFFRTSPFAAPSADLDVRQVLVVRSETSQARLRGHILRGRPVESFYNGFDTQAVTADESLPSRVSTHRPRLIHLCATFAESSSSGGVYAHFGRETQPLSPGYLAKLLSVCSPFVVIDAAREAGPTETLRQLTLRNAFAAELHALGGVNAVLCTGLFSPSTQDAAYAMLAEAFQSGVTGGGLTTQLRSFRAVAEDPLMDWWASDGVALFASRADFRICVVE